MASNAQRILAIGGASLGPSSTDWLLHQFMLDLSGRERPRICFVATASGENAQGLAAFYATFARRAEPTHLDLFGRQVEDVEAFLLDQDVIYVGGGNTANLLAVWRAHGIDRILRRAWAEGVVLTGLSAGSLCWFEGGTTDSFGGLAALRDGLGFLPGSHTPHYDGEPGRRPTYHRLVADGSLPDGYAADDCAALVYRGTQLVEVVTSQPAARGYRVERGPNGRAVETELPARYLG